MHWIGHDSGTPWPTHPGFPGISSQGVAAGSQVVVRQNAAASRESSDSANATANERRRRSTAREGSTGRLRFRGQTFFRQP
jgi:hypothetical protein